MSNIDVISEMVRSLKEESIPQIRAELAGLRSDFHGRLVPLESKVTALMDWKIEADTKSRIKSELKHNSLSEERSKRESLFYPIVVGLVTLIFTLLASHFLHL